MCWLAQAARNSQVGIVVVCPPDQGASVRDSLIFLLARICKVGVCLHQCPGGQLPAAAPPSARQDICQVLQ